MTQRRTPDPPTHLAIATIRWRAGTPIHRIHLDRYAAQEFNCGRDGNARFSPIQDTRGAPIPTLYGGTTFDCAAMETVFHDVPFVPGLKTFDKRRLLGQVHSVLSSAADLTLADLSSVGLRKLGLRRRDLVETAKYLYPRTRERAQAIHRQSPDIQGLCWVSRQDDRGRAVMLFGDRIHPSCLQPVDPTRSLPDDPVAFSELLVLAETIGVLVIDGNRAS